MLKFGMLLLFSLIIVIHISNTTGNTTVEGGEDCELYDGPAAVISSEGIKLLVMGVRWKLLFANRTSTEDFVYPGDILSLDNFTMEASIHVTCFSTHPVKWISSYENSNAKQHDVLGVTSLRSEEPEIYAALEKLSLLRFMDAREVITCQSIGSTCRQIVFASSTPELPYHWTRLDPASPLPLVVQEFRNDLLEAEKHQNLAQEDGKCLAQLDICYDPEDTRFKLQWIINGTEMEGIEFNAVFHLTGQSLENFFRFSPTITASCIQTSCNRTTNGLVFFWKDFGYKSFSTAVNLVSEAGSGLSRNTPNIIGKFTTDLYHRDIYYPGKPPALSDMARLQKFPRSVFKGLSFDYSCLSSSAYFSVGTRGLVAEVYNETHAGDFVSFPLNPHPTTVYGAIYMVGQFNVLRNASYEFLIVSCKFPVSSGPEWYVPGRVGFVQVLDSEEPSILAPAAINISDNAPVLYFAKIGEDFILNCTAEGIPIPTVGITGEASDLNLTETCQSIDDTTVICELKFTPFSPIHIGIYKCVAVNDLGSASLLYEIQIKKVVEIPINLAGFQYGLGIGLIILALIFAISLWRIFQHQYMFKKVNKHIFEKFEAGLTKEQLTSLSKFESPLKSLKIGNEILGAGMFGQIRMARVVITSDGNYPQERTIACKMMQPNCKDITKFENLLRELTVLSHLGKHPNIVSLVACHTSSIIKRKVFLGLEYCCNKDLLTYLRSFDPNDALNIINGPNATTRSFCLYNSCIQIADGLLFLKSKDIVHCDIAARNILLDGRNVAKISDFGLARNMCDQDEMKKSNISKNDDLPWRWAALETLKHNTFSHASDIWSFGVTLWELFTFGALPWPNTEWNDEFINQIENGIRLSKPKHASEIMQVNKYQRVLMQCWQCESEKRICLEDVKKLFLNLLGTLVSDEKDNYALI